LCFVVVDDDAGERFEPCDLLLHRKALGPLTRVLQFKPNTNPATTTAAVVAAAAAAADAVA
jgi:hypothetical protein